MNKNVNDDEAWMRHAQKLAQKAEALGEVPVGAVVVKQNEIVGEGFNCPITQCDPTAHAEIVALRNAAHRLGNYRLVDCTLYVTLEPCTMCVGALIHSRITRLVYGAKEPKAGVVESQANLHEALYVNHKMLVSGGVCAEACGSQLRDFFKARRVIHKKSN